MKLHAKSIQNIVAALVALAAFWGDAAARACPGCREQVRAGIYNREFAGNLLVVLLPILIVMAVGLAAYLWDGPDGKISAKKGFDD